MSIRVAGASLPQSVLRGAAKARSTSASPARALKHRYLRWKGICRECCWTKLEFWETTTLQDWSCDLKILWKEFCVLVDSLLLFFPSFIFFHRAVRFKGYQQQDSQELLRYLLDGMRAEEHQVSMLVTASHCLVCHLLSSGVLKQWKLVTEAIGLKNSFHQPFSECVLVIRVKWFSFLWCSILRYVSSIIVLQGPVVQAHTPRATPPSRSALPVILSVTPHSFWIWEAQWSSNDEWCFIIALMRCLST